MYWIPKINNSKGNLNESGKYEHYIYRKNVYRDVVCSNSIKSEHQLRPNGCIAIAVAPELFRTEHARYYLATVELTLLESKSLGVKTLDKLFPEFVPFYDNKNDSNEKLIAHGFSYHNGPVSYSLNSFY